MTKEEFQEIIKPLFLLNGKECQFIKSALEANFDNWYKSKAENLPISGVSVSNVDIKDLREDLIASYSMIGEIVEGTDEGKNLLGYCIHRLDAGGYSR